MAAGPDGVLIGYRVVGDPGTSFDIGIFRSTDGVFDGGDEVLGGLNISNPNDLTAGDHYVALPIGVGDAAARLPGVGTPETDDEYHVLVVVDAGDAVTEDDADPFAEDNTTTLAGSYAMSNGEQMVLGSPGADTYTLSADRASLNVGNYLIGLNAVSGFRVRMLGGDDRLDFRTSRVPVVAWGGDGNDSIWGGSAPDDLRGGERNDLLVGGAGSDFLYGDDGNDSLNGGAGNDYLAGGPGNNTLTGGSGSDVWSVTGTAGDDTILLQTVNKLLLVTSGAVTIQQDLLNDLAQSMDTVHIDAGAGNDRVELQGSPASRLFGGPGNDTLVGGTRSDLLDGGPGDDVLSGGPGNDLLYGGSGNDTVDGGTGNDVHPVSGDTDRIEPSAGINQTVFSSSSGPQTITFTATGFVRGSVEGLSGGGPGTLIVTIQVQPDGSVTGTFTGSGNGTASGSGCTATYGWTITSGTVTGTEGALRLTGTFFASGTAKCNIGGTIQDIPFSGNGSCSATGSMATGAMSGRWVVDGGGGSWSGAMTIGALTVASPSPDTIADPRRLNTFTRPANLKGLAASLLAGHILTDPRIDSSAVVAPLTSILTGMGLYGMNAGGQLTVLAAGYASNAMQAVMSLADTFGNVQLAGLFGMESSAGRNIYLDLGNRLGVHDLYSPAGRVNGVLDIIDTKALAGQIASYFINFDGETSTRLTTAGAVPTSTSTLPAASKWLYSKTTVSNWALVNAQFKKMMNRRFEVRHTGAVTSVRG